MSHVASGARNLLLFETQLLNTNSIFSVIDAIRISKDFYVSRNTAPAQFAIVQMELFYRYTKRSSESRLASDTVFYRTMNPQCNLNPCYSHRFRHENDLLSRYRSERLAVTNQGKHSLNHTSSYSIVVPFIAIRRLC